MERFEDKDFDFDYRVTFSKIFGDPVARVRVEDLHQARGALRGFPKADTADIEVRLSDGHWWWVESYDDRPDGFRLAQRREVTSTDPRPLAAILAGCPVPSELLAEL